MHNGIIRWNQYALIADLAEKLNNVSPQFGKTALQKIVFILQEAYKVPCGYKFSLYSYGPYCSELPKDLDIVEHLCGVDVCTSSTGFGGVFIIPGEKCSHIKIKARSFLDQNENAIAQAVKNFGHYSARELELRSTVLYCFLDIQKSKRLITADRLLSIVATIKPKFSNEEIMTAIESLSELKIISYNNNAFT